MTYRSFLYRVEVLFLQPLKCLVRGTCRLRVDGCKASGGGSSLVWYTQGHIWVEDLAEKVVTIAASGAPVSQAATLFYRVQIKVVFWPWILLACW